MKRRCVYQANRIFYLALQSGTAKEIIFFGGQRFGGPWLGGGFTRGDAVRYA